MSNPSSCVLLGRWERPTKSVQPSRDAARENSPLAAHYTWQLLHKTMCSFFFVKAAFNENQCGTRQAALNKETQLPSKKVLEALDSPQQELLKVPGLRKQQAKQEKRDAKMLLGQNMGDT